MHSMQTQLPDNRLGALIADRGVKLSVLAAHCDVDQSTIWRWRGGHSPIPDEQKFVLAAYFDVSVPYLMGWVDTEAAA